MATPPTRRRIFVAWDHSVPKYRVELNALVGGAGLRPEYVARLSGGDDPPGPISEEILRDIGSDCVLAFLERPNCNVLFEAVRPAWPSPSGEDKICSLACTSPSRMASGQPSARLPRNASPSAAGACRHGRQSADRR